MVVPREPCACFFLPCPGRVCPKQNRDGGEEVRWCQQSADSGDKMGNEAREDQWPGCDQIRSQAPCLLAHSALPRKTHSFIRATRTSLVVQWLRFHISNEGGPCLIPGQRTRPHMHAATKSSHTATKDPASHHEDRRSCMPQLTQCSQRNKINICKLHNQQGPTIYRTGNSAQYSIITQMREEFEKD